MQAQNSFVLYLTQKAEYRVRITPDCNEPKLQEKTGGKWVETGHSCRSAIRRICEIEVPLSPLDLAVGDYIFVSLTYLRGDEDIGRWPADAPMKLLYAGGEIELDTWLI